MKVTNKRQKFDSDDSSNSEIDMSIHSDSDIDEVASDVTISESSCTLVPAENNNTLHDSGKACASPIAGCSRSNEIPVAEYAEYQENDTVLVRYLGKKKVDYFVGKVVSKTIKRDSYPVYTVSFFKKVGRNDNTRFLATPKDIDTIPATMIVKNVNLLTLNEKETEFILLEDEDYIYFDY